MNKSNLINYLFNKKRTILSKDFFPRPSKMEEVNPLVIKRPSQQIPKKLLQILSLQKAKKYFRHNNRHNIFIFDMSI